MEELRAKGPLVVIDAGASLNVQPRGPRPEAEPRDLDQRRLKAELIVDAWKLGGIDAVALGAVDWSLGSDWLEAMLDEKQAPVVAANLWCGGERPFPASRIVESGGYRVGIVGVTRGEVAGCEVRDGAAALKEALAELGQVDVTLALVPAQDDRELATVLDGSFEVDVVFDARSKRSGNRPDERGGAWAFGSGSRGKQVGVLDLTWTAGATTWAPQGQAEALTEEIARTEQRLEAQKKRLETASEAQLEAFRKQVSSTEELLAGQRARLSGASTAVTHALSNREIELEKAMTEHPATRIRIDQTLEKLRGVDPRSALAGVMDVKHVAVGGVFAGSDACAACHRAEHEQWTGTAHAGAWASLVSQKRDGDAECFSCHATGVGAATGPTAPHEVGGLRDVQCEACHGPARAHVAAPAENQLVVDPGQAGCVTCHDGQRDEGRFDYGAYRPRVVHGAK